MTESCQQRWNLSRPQNGWGWKAPLVVWSSSHLLSFSTRPHPAGPLAPPKRHHCFPERLFTPVAGGMCVFIGLKGIRLASGGARCLLFVWKNVVSLQGELWSFWMCKEKCVRPPRVHAAAWEDDFESKSWSLWTLNYKSWIWIVWNWENRVKSKRKAG